MRESELESTLCMQETCLESDQDFLYIESTESGALYTGVYRFFCLAQLALDLATPVEDTGAPLDHIHFLSLVAPAAAHQIAAVNAEAGFVALSPVGAEDTQGGTLDAEIRRRLHVDEVLRPGRFVLRIGRLQLKVVALPTRETIAMLVHGVARRVHVRITAHAIRIADHYLGGTVEPILQIIAD